MDVTKGFDPLKRFEATPKQDEFIKAVLSGKHSQLLYGGSIAGGKSFVLCALAILFCKMWPGSRWAIIRKDLPRIRKHLLPTFWKVAPIGFCGSLNKSEWTVTCANGSEILFFPASESDDPEHNRLRGLEIDGALVDECNEISLPFWRVLGTRCGRWLGAKMPPSAGGPLPLRIATCNPTGEWPKVEFYKPYVENRLDQSKFYLPATMTDNPHLTPEYIANVIDSVGGEGSDLYKVFVMGEWDLADAPDQLIKYDWVVKAFEADPTAVMQHPRKLGVDIAWEGDDCSVICASNGFLIDYMKAYEHVDPTTMGNYTQALIAEHNITPAEVAVDGVGLGAGVVSNLYAEGLRVHNFSAGSKAIGRDKVFTFANRRTEGWWALRQLFKQGMIAFTKDFSKTQGAKDKLVEDLLSIKYKITGERVLAVESKKELKKRLGRSTDYGDALMMCTAPRSGSLSFWDAVRKSSKAE